MVGTDVVPSAGSCGDSETLMQKSDLVVIMTPAGDSSMDETNDAVRVNVVVGSVTDSGSGKTLKRAVVSLTASGNLVALVSAKMIKVYAFSLQSISDTMTVQITDGSGGTALDQLWTLNAREGVMASAVNPPAYLLKTSAGVALYLTITGTGTIKAVCSYWDDDAS